jgi:pseudaminic acid synthase
MYFSDILLGDKTVAHHAPPFIIAEMSGNHNQSLDKALAIVDSAAASGVHALKIQTYTAETMTLDLSENEFFISDPNNIWQGQSLYKLYEQAHTPWDWHEAIFNRCKKHGILGFSTPFDETAVDFLESLDVPFYKVASFENTDIPLIKKILATKKPIIISTGMASVAELMETVNTVKDHNNDDLILLKCTSTYPAEPVKTNINTIPHMSQLFDCHVGLSDHTMGIGVAVASVALGARVIEKHFTLDRSKGGVDSSFSLEPSELSALVTETHRAWQALGKIQYGIASDNEAKSLQYRRSLYVTKDLAVGDFISKNNVRAIRPGMGLAPKHLPTVLGKQVKLAIKKGTPLQWNLLQ